MCFLLPTGKCAPEVVFAKPVWLVYSEAVKTRKDHFMS